MLTPCAIPSFPIRDLAVHIAALTLLATLAATDAGTTSRQVAHPDEDAASTPMTSTDPSTAPGAVAKTPSSVARSDPAPQPVAVASAVVSPPASASIGSPPARQATGRRDGRRARASAFGIVLELRSDFGFERLVEVEFTNDRRVTMNLNDGLTVAAGLSFLPLGGGRFTTRVSGGVKLDRLRADNGTALFIAFPIDVMEGVYVGPFRLGAGASVLLSPRIRGDGILERAGGTFRPAPGVVADAEWIVAPERRTGIGVRASWYRFEWQGSVRGAPSIGLLLRADFDVTGR